MVVHFGVAQALPSVSSPPFPIEGTLRILLAVLLNRVMSSEVRRLRNYVFYACLAACVSAAIVFYGCAVGTVVGTVVFCVGTVGTVVMSLTNQNS